MKKWKIYLIFLIIIIIGIVWFAYWSLTVVWGPPRGYDVEVVVTGNATNVTILMPIIYVKDKPIFEYDNVKFENRWTYKIVNTKYGKMLELHTEYVNGSKIIFKGHGLFDFPVVEVNTEVDIKPSNITNESTFKELGATIRLINYTMPFYTSHNLTIVVNLTVCSGISLFEPIYNGKKYCGSRLDKIVVSGKGWIIGRGYTKIDMWFRKHWYDL